VLILIAYLDFDHFPSLQEQFNRNIDALVKWIEGAIQRFRSGVKNSRVILRLQYLYVSLSECLIPASTDTMQQGWIDDQFPKRIDQCHVERREPAYAADIDR
jgi:hypothetical protein